MKPVIDLAIVIPTLNEEYYIGKLLDSIAQQTFKPAEVVVVDANSQDRTIFEIAKRKKNLPKLSYYQIPKYSISRQRNYGAKMTSSPHILFLDADVHLRDMYALEDYMKEILTKKPDIAIATNLPDSDIWKDKVLFVAGDLLMKISKPIWPTAVGINMYVNRKTFNKLGGFDEDIKLAEDFELVQRMTKKRYRFLILGKPRIHSSVRRWRENGRFRTFFFMIYSLCWISVVGYKKNPTNYEFGNHDIIQ